MRNEFLLAFSLKGTFVLVAAFGVNAVLRRASASARHLVWTIAFMALLLLPLLSQVTPTWNAPLPASPHVLVQSSPAINRMPVEPARPAFDWIFSIWLLGGALVFSRFLAGTIRVRLKVRRALPMSVAGVSDKVRLLDVGPGAMPMTWGVLRPVVLLPSEANGWPAERLRIVLLHELTHVARQDCLTLAISELALALYWFHPLSWWGANRMRKEREQACDDRVLADGVVASDYAGSLIHIARGHKNSMLVAPAMARGSNLETRLRAILDPTIRRRSMTARMAATASVIALLVLLPLASWRLHGQGAGLSGVVYDASGAVIPGAVVTIINNATSVTTTLSADPAGRYSFPDIPAGAYQVTVESAGFAPFLRKEIAVPGTLDATLSLSQVETRFVVSGKRSQTVAPTPIPQRIRVGGNVQYPIILSAPKPSYPPQAESAGIQGRVLLQGVIRTDGSVMGLKALSTPSVDLADAAVAAVQEWHYRPALLNGQPVEAVTTIAVDFRLDQ